MKKPITNTSRDETITAEELERDNKPFIRSETMTLVQLKDHLQNLCYEGHSENPVYIIYKDEKYPVTELDAVTKITNDNENTEILISIA